MKALELANYELSYSYPDKTAIDVKNVGILQSVIICSDGTEIRVNGLIAQKLNSALQYNGKVKTFSL